MPEFTPQVLCHLVQAKFRGKYYQLAKTERKQFHQSLLKDLCASAPSVQIYQVYPASAGTDIFIWSSLPVDQPEQAAAFFERFARATIPYRELLEPVDTLWGFSRPSQYTKSRSTQEIDPLSPVRKRYFIAYPFIKTAEWYLLSQETRQGIMNGHIKVGKQYPQITQLLLYSFGLQDQEFIVAYETDDLVGFSNLVYALRDTEARRYTLRDTPLMTAIYHPAEETLALWE